MATTDILIRQMKRLAAVGMLAAASVAVPTLTAQAEEVVLRALTFSPPGKVEESMVVFATFVERVNAAGKGVLKIEHIGGPEVVPVRDQVSAVSKGVADMVMTLTVHVAQVPEIDSVGLSDITIAEERKIGYIALLDEAHKKINIKVIGRTATDAGFYIFSKDPITKLADFKGMKMRANAGNTALFEKVGAVPVNMAISEIYAGLERGIVRGASYPLYVYDLGLHEVTKYALADRFWPSHTTFTYMNREKFESLTPKQQALIMDTQLQLEKDMPEIIEAVRVKERARLEKAGMVFNHLPPDEAKKWKRMANETRFEASKIPPDQLAKIKAMIVRE